MNITTRSKLQSQMIEIVHILVQMMKEHTETILPCGRFSQRHFTAEKQTPDEHLSFQFEPCTI